MRLEWHACLGQLHDTHGGHLRGHSGKSLLSALGRSVVEVVSRAIHIKIKS